MALTVAVAVAVGVLVGLALRLSRRPTDYASASPREIRERFERARRAWRADRERDA